MKLPMELKLAMIKMGRNISNVEHGYSNKKRGLKRYRGNKWQKKPIDYHVQESIQF